MIILQKIKDILFFPIRVIFDHEKVTAWGLTSIRDERFKICYRYARGRMLDIGCGDGNRFINTYQNGLGLDNYAWEGVDVVADAECLPFDEQSFETVLFIGSINHVLNKGRALQEAYRVLKTPGRVLITVTDPFWGLLRHKLAWWDKDQHVRGMRPGENYGLWPADLMRLLKHAGFKSVKRKVFLYGLNNLYIGEKQKCARGFYRDIK